MLYLIHADHARLKRRGESALFSGSDLSNLSEDGTKQAEFYHELLSMVIGDNKVLDMNAVITLYNQITQMFAKNVQVRELVERDMATVIKSIEEKQSSFSVLKTHTPRQSCSANRGFHI